MDGRTINWSEFSEFSVSVEFFFSILIAISFCGLFAKHEHHIMCLNILDFWAIHRCAVVGLFIYLFIYFYFGFWLGNNLFLFSNLVWVSSPFPTIHKHVNNSCMATFTKPLSKPLYQTRIPSQILINFTQPSSIFSTRHYSGSVPQHYQVSSSTPYLLHHTHPHPSYPPLITCPRCLLYHSYSHSSHPLNSYTHLNGLPISQCLGKWSLSFVAHVFS